MNVGAVECGHEGEVGEERGLNAGGAPGIQIWEVVVRRGEAVTIGFE